MKYIFVFLSILFLAVTANSQECSAHRRHLAKPWTWTQSNMCGPEYDEWLASHPQKAFFKSKQFWIGTAIIAASVAADYKTTSNAAARGYTESSPLLGDHPSNRRIAAVGFAAFSTYTALHIASYQLAKYDPNNYWRTFAHWQMPVVAALIHGPAAEHNASLP
jgi:hypothetical protein